MCIATKIRAWYKKFPLDTTKAVDVEDETPAEGGAVNEGAVVDQRSCTTCRRLWSPSVPTNDTVRV